MVNLYPWLLKRPQLNRCMSKRNCDCVYSLSKDSSSSIHPLPQRRSQMYLRVTLVMWHCSSTTHCSFRYKCNKELEQFWVSSCLIRLERVGYFFKCVDLLSVHDTKQYTFKFVKESTNVSISDYLVPYNVNLRVQVTRIFLVRLHSYYSLTILKIYLLL